MKRDVVDNSTCPMSDSVRRLARNSTSADERSQIERHLDTCDVCQAIAEEDHTHSDIDAALQQISQRKDSTPNDLTVPIRQLNESLADYEILEQIGKGGMGVVYKARQVHLGRLVALKVLPSFYGIVRPNLLAQFKTEAGIAARLKHSSIISIYDFGEVSGTLFYAMELIEGRTIADFVRDVRRPSDAGEEKSGRKIVAAGRDGEGQDPTGPNPKENCGQQNARGSVIGREYFRHVAKWMADVADALAYAHNSNVIHGDIKPANILVTNDDRVLLADFGLARHRAAIEEDVTKSTLGTLRYMSPEQIDRSRGRPDHRSDVYAIGATFYELLTLRPMVDSAHDPEVLLDVLNRAPISPRRLMPQVPRELETICLKACEKLPTNRYVSAAELAADLNRWLLDLPILAKKPSIAIRILKFVRRHRGAVAGVALVSVALIISSAVYRNAQESQRQATIATDEARKTVMDLGLATAIQHLYFDRSESALRGVRAVAAAYPNELDPALLEWAILLRIGDNDDASGRLDTPHLKGAAPAWVHDLHTSNNAVVRDEQNRSLAEMDADEVFLRSILEKDAHRALPLLKTALDRSPNHILCNVVNCFLHHEVGDYEEMQHSADRIMLLRPHWAIGFGLRGLAVLSMGSYEDANLSLTRAILLQPECARWWNLRSRVNLRFSRFAEAVDDASKAISLAPYLDSAYVNRAIARMSLDSFEGAIEDISYLIEKTGSAPLYVFRSRIHAAALNVDEQISDLVVASNLDPLNTETAVILGNAYLGTLKYAQAIREFDRALEIDSDNFRLRFKRAFVLELSGESEAAAAEYRQLDEPGAPLADKALFFLYLITEKSESSNASVAFSPERPPKTLWHSRILSFLAGELSADELVDEAESPTEKSESHFYIARALLKRRAYSAARHHIKACLEARQVNTLEYDLARALLKQDRAH